MWFFLIPYFLLVLIYIFISKIYKAVLPPGTITSAVVKCLPVIYLLVLIVFAPKLEPERNYRYAIGLGYVFSLGGDLFLNWPKTYFIQGLGSFAISQICYIYGFGFSPFGWPTLLVFVVAGVCVLMVLLPDIRQTVLKIAVIFYITLLIIAGWRATVRYKQNPNWGNWMAMTGALVFLVSDFTIAFNRWKKKFRGSMLLIMTTYYIAQLLFALSVLIPVMAAARRMRFMGM